MNRKPKLPLNPTAIEALPTGWHRIAERLYLKHDAGTHGGSRRLVIFRWQQSGKPRSLSLGPWSRAAYSAFLAEGRRLCEAVDGGRDPAAARVVAAAPDTFRAAAKSYLERKAGVFTSAEHLANCRAAIDKLDPWLGDVRILDLEPGHIVRALSADWLRVPTTSRKVLQMIRNILDFGLARLDPMRKNAASWDILQHLLPEQPKSRPRHHRAIAWADVPTFHARLCEKQSPSRSALRFLLLTLARTNEVVGARWEEIDFGARVWTVDPSRMKTREPHRVPLSEPALALLREVEAMRWNDYLFPSPRLDDKPLGNDALYCLLKETGLVDVTTNHGLRSTFKDWARETSAGAWEAVELCLAHEVGSQVERAYGRSDLLHLRQPIMEQWGRHLIGQPPAEGAKRKATLRVV